MTLQRSGTLLAVVGVMAVAVLLFAWIGFQRTVQNHRPYAGEQVREIASFSRSDIAALKAGRGWGLSKSAELNGYPGPRHVLDLAMELELTSRQQRRISKVFHDMSTFAKAGGATLLDAERALDVAFRGNKIDAAILQQLLRRAEQARGDLRHTHLSAHLETARLLNSEQRKRYADLRGYSFHSKH